ncbi:MAG: AraC family transcriptional regulator [Pseudomonadales bacterium]|jgi:AraC-like DNA-binding protein|nr:AraC family transcriptional regulator [Pseudomonadales bacterium]
MTMTMTNALVSARGMAEFSLEQTTLRVGDKVKLMASSQGLGWSDMFVAITDESPHETLHRVLPDMWLALALTPADVQRTSSRFQRRQWIPKGAISIAGAGEAMYDKMTSPIQVMYVYLRHDVLDEVAEALFADGRERRNVGSMFCLSDVVLRRLLAFIRMMVLEPRGSNQLKVDYFSQVLAARLLENHSVIGPPREVPRAPAFNSWEIGQVIDYMNDNLSLNMSIGELADIVGLGRTQFIARFKATVSLTPHQFVILRRICKAKAMLATKRCVDHRSIALSCGFVSQAHFITTFKKIVGKTPREYRLSVI